MSAKARMFIAGVLAANSGPHLATAAAGRRHLTPLAGRESPPAVNLAWAAANLLGSCLLLRTGAGSGRRSDRWDSRLLAFEAGYLGWALWMAASEYVLELNWDR
jgi:hypothetical protein